MEATGESRLVNVLEKGFVELLESMGNDQTICQAARVSTLKESKGEESDKKLIHYLMKNKHDSPFEQVILRFRLRTPLFVRSQIMRHRTFSYNEVSRRYTEEQIDFYIPKTLRLQDVVNKQGSTEQELDKIYIEVESTNDEDDYVIGLPVYNYIHSICHDAVNNYETLLKQGVAREQARMVLPQNLYTMFYMTGNLRNFLHFVELRSDPHAQYETRVYSDAMYTMLQGVAPWSCEAWNLYRRS